MQRRLVTLAYTVSRRKAELHQELGYDFYEGPKVSGTVSLATEYSRVQLVLWCQIPCVAFLIPLAAGKAFLI